MRCGRCGVDLIPGAAFCPSCGRPAESAAAEFLIDRRSSVPPVAGLRPNVAGLLCYSAGCITGFFFLVVSPYKRDHFVRFHAYQAIFLSVVYFLFYSAAAFFPASLPRMFWPLGELLRLFLNLGFFCLWLFLMVRAYRNDEFKVPVIGEMAARQS